MDECLTIPAADQGDDQRRWDTKPYATVCKHTQTANLHHNQSIFSFIQKCTLWRWSRVQPCQISLETGASSHWVGAISIQWSLNRQKVFLLLSWCSISLHTVGVVATWSGVSPSGCVTSQQAGICAWMKRKDSCLWTRKRRIQRALLSAFVLLRSLYCSQLYNSLGGCSFENVF